MSEKPSGDLRTALLRGTIYDSELEGVLDEGARGIREETDPDEVLGARPDHDPSVLVSLSPHALHYLDLRMALLIRTLHDADVDITLILRDHQTLGHPDPQLSFPQGKGRFLDVLHLLGVPTNELTVVTWTDLASRLALDDELYAFLEALDMIELGERLEHCPPEFRSMTEAYSTLLDIYIASDAGYHPSRWLIGGPTRYPVHDYGIRVFRDVFDEEPVGTLPLPRLPYLPSLPSIVPEPQAQRKDVLEDCRDLDREQLTRLHRAFFAPVEEFLGVTLNGRGKLDGKLDELSTTQLVGLTADAFEHSLELLQQEVKRADPEQRLEVPPARLPEVVEALGHDPRRLKVLETLMEADQGLEAKQILERLRLPRSKMSTLRRDLNDLKDAGLLIAKGVKPITYHPSAKRIDITMGPET